MLLLDKIPEGFLSKNAENLLDSTLLTLFSTPFIWILVIRKLHNKAELESTRFYSLFEAAPEGILCVSRDGKIRLANDQATRLFGYSREELLNEPVEHLIPDGLAGAYPEKQQSHLINPRTLANGAGVDLRGLRKNGSEFVAEVSLSHLQTPEGPIVLCLVRDTTEKRNSEEIIRNQNIRLESGMQELQQRMGELEQLAKMGELLRLCENTREIFSVVASSMRQIFRDSRGALYIRKNNQNIFESVASWGGAESAAEFQVDACWALRKGRIHVVSDAEVQCPHAEGNCGANSVCVPILAQGEATGILYTNSGSPADGMNDSAQQLLAAISERIGHALTNLRLREALREQSVRDPLTGLFNRRFMDEWLEREIHRAARAGHPLSLILIDIDHFKAINDTYGHEGGDEVLRKLAYVLEEQIRAGDIACRFGGEEFVLLLPETPLNKSRELAERIRIKLEAMSLHHLELPLPGITASFGCAEYPSHGDSGQKIVRAADLALYQAKAAGRNRVLVASSVLRLSTGDGNSPLHSVG